MLTTKARGSFSDLSDLGGRGSGKLVAPVAVTTEMEDGR